MSGQPSSRQGNLRPFYFQSRRTSHGNSSVNSRQLRADLRPVNALEDEIVEQIADTAWRLKRFSHIQAAVETSYIEEAAGKEDNAGKHDHRILGDALTFHGCINNLATLGRYESQLSGRFHRAIKELRDLRKTRGDTFFVARPFEEREKKRQQPQASRPTAAADHLITPVAQAATAKRPNGPNPSQHS